METWDELRKRASRQMAGNGGAFTQRWPAIHLWPFHPPFPVPMRKGYEMEWKRPRKLIEENVQKPIQTIAVIAVIALAVAAMALFVAMGKDTNNAA